MRKGSDLRPPDQPALTNTLMTVKAGLSTPRCSAPLLAVERPTDNTALWTMLGRHSSGEIECAPKVHAVTDVARDTPTRRLLMALGPASGMIVLFAAGLSIPLSSAEDLGLTRRETVGWIMALYGLPGLLTILFMARHRQPLLLTGNLFLLVFVASLGRHLTWPELIGASIVAGTIVLVLGPLGIVQRLAAWLPAPIVFGLLAGAVLPFFVDLFTVTGDEPLIVGTTLVVYVFGRRCLDPKVPALLPALVVGIALTAATGEFGALPTEVEFIPAFTVPELSLNAVATATPVMVMIITLQANVPSLVFLREHGYEPPESALSAASGLGTAGGSVLGPTGVSLSLPATALLAGNDAGAHDRRHWAVAIAAGASLLMGATAGLATAVAEAIPEPLLVALVGLAVVGILWTALANVTRGRLTLGPMFAFAISQSELELAGLGPFFWALAGGLAVSILLEGDEWRALRAASTS